MSAELSPQQRAALQRELAIVRQLLAVPSVSKHDSRFEGEIALVASSGQLEPIAAIVEERFGAPLKAAGDEPPEELASLAMTRAMGGLRRNQTLYAKAVADALSIYVAFWPWGGGARFTIKVGVHSDG